MALVSHESEAATGPGPKVARLEAHTRIHILMRQQQRQQQQQQQQQKAAGTRANRNKRCASGVIHRSMACSFSNGEIVLALGCGDSRLAPQGGEILEVRFVARAVTRCCDNNGCCVCVHVECNVYARALVCRGERRVTPRGPGRCGRAGSGPWLGGLAPPQTCPRRTRPGQFHQRARRYHRQQQ